MAVLWLLGRRSLAIGLGMMLGMGRLLCMQRRMFIGKRLSWRRPLLRVGLQNRIDLPPSVFRCVLLESFEGQKLWFGAHLFMTPMDMRLRN